MLPDRFNKQCVYFAVANSRLSVLHIRSLRVQKHRSRSARDDVSVTEYLITRSCILLLVLVLVLRGLGRRGSAVCVARTSKVHGTAPRRRRWGI